MSEVAVTFTGDDAALLRAFQRQEKNAQKMKTDAADVGKAGRAAARDLERFAEATKKIVSTPIEKYNQHLAKLSAALKADLLTQEQHDRAVKRAGDNYDRLRTAAMQSSTATQKTTVSSAGAASGIGALASKLVTLIPVVGAAYKAWEQYNRVLDENLQISRDAREAQAALAKSQEMAVHNLPGMARKDVQKLLGEDVFDISAELGFGDIPALVGAIEGVADIIDDKSQIKQTVATASELTRLNPDQTGDLAKAIAQVSKSSGEVDPKKVMGLLIQAGAMAEVKSPEKLGKTLAQTITTGTALAPEQDAGEAALDTAALFGTIGGYLHDTKGETSKSVTLEIESELRDFFKERPELKQETSHMGRLAAVAAPGNEKLAEQFRDKFSGSAEAKNVVEQLTRANSELTQDLRKNREEVAFSEAPFRKVSEAQQALPQVQVAMTDAKSKAAQQRFLMDPDVAIRSQMADNTKKVLSMTRAPGAAPTAASLANEEMEFQSIRHGAKNSEEASRIAMNALERQKTMVLDAEPGIGLDQLKALKKHKTLTPEVLDSFGVGHEAQQKVFLIQSEEENVQRTRDDMAKRELERREEKRRATLTPEQQKQYDQLDRTKPADPLDPHHLAAPTDPTAAQTPAPSRPDTRPKVDHHADLVKRREKLLKKAYDVSSDDKKPAIEFAERVKKDPDLTKLRKEGGLDRRLKHEGISKEDYYNAEDYLAVRDKKELSETEIADLPGLEEDRASLRLVQQRFREEQEKAKKEAAPQPKPDDRTPNTPPALSASAASSIAAEGYRWVNEGPPAPTASPSTAQTNAPAGSSSGSYTEDGSEGEVFWSGIDPRTIKPAGEAKALTPVAPPPPPPPDIDRTAPGRPRERYSDFVPMISDSTQQADPARRGYDISRVERSPTQQSATALKEPMESPSTERAVVPIPGASVPAPSRESNQGNNEAAFRMQRAIEQFERGVEKFTRLADALGGLISLIQGMRAPGRPIPNYPDYVTRARNEHAYHQDH